MIVFATRLAVLGAFAFATAANAAPAAPTAAKPATAKPVAGDPSILSSDFWGDWNKTKTSENFSALTKAVGCAHKSNTPKAGGSQKIVDLAINRPEDAAKFLGDATAASNDAVSANALATVVNMVTSPKTREEAAPLVAPEAKARVEAMTANLSTGIQGLPGIYLGDVPQPKYEAGTQAGEGSGGANTGGGVEASGGSAGAGERASVPAGYAPVVGGSMGCPVR